MPKTILVVAPHPDDETLGCGGALLRQISAGSAVHWLIVTAMAGPGYSARDKKRRRDEVRAVARQYPFAAVHELGFPAARLDTVPLGDIVARMGAVFKKTAPHAVYLPYLGDAHSDHRVSFEAAAACTKWFRYPSLKRVLAYETPSETDFALRPDDPAFKPNVFVDIAPYLRKKLAILQTYASELGAFPFPRSETAVRALALVRGAACGAKAAESFMLLREVS